MKHRLSLRSGIGARFLVAAVGLSALVSACADGDTETGDDDGGGGSQSGSAGKGAGGSKADGGSKPGDAGAPTNGGSSAGTAGTSGSGGSSGSSTEGGAGGIPSEGGAGATPPEGGGAGEPNGEGGQGGAPPEPEPASKVVFGDDYAAGVGFVPFGDSVNDITIDATTAHSGTSSLKIQVPAAGYTGGAFTSGTEEDLSAFNAVSFWAKASAAHPLNAVGLGNDGAPGSRLTVERNALELTTEWQRFVVPVPSPSKLMAENGLFHFAEADSAAYTIWLDDIEYTTVSDLGVATAAIATEARNITIGSTFPVPGTSVSYVVNALPLTLSVGPSWFDYISLDEAVASVENGVVSGDGAGSTEITAELDGALANGKITVNVSEASIPTLAAPTPLNAPVDVISLFSNAFTNVQVDTWSAVWDVADVANLTVAGNDTKVYTNLTYAGVEFAAFPVDATTMTHLHADVWMPAATVFRIKLVDFGANGVYGGGDDTEAEVEKNGLTTKTWQSLEFALSDFTGLASRAHLAQMIVTSSAAATVYFDNIYFHK